MADLTHFDMLPLAVDPESSTVSSTNTSRSLNAELAALNALHRTLLSSPEATHPKTHVTLPPVPVNPKRSANVTKLRENGNAEYKKDRFAEAHRLYTLGIQMAVARPSWEPSAIAREEVSGLYANRAQASMALGNWAEAAVDADTSVEVRKQGNAKAWWRKGKCLMEMGRLEDAREWVKKALELEGQEAELTALLKEIDDKITAAGKAKP
jgi:translocation protein SEC72